MSSKRPREEDHYRSREISRRKDEGNHHHHKLSNYDGNYDDRNHANNYYYGKNHHDRKNERENQRNPDRHYDDRNFKRNHDTNDNERNRERNHQFEHHKKSADQSTMDIKPTVSKISTSITTNPSSISTDNPDEKPLIKEKVNFNKSGKLAEDTNMHNGVIVKYSEPIEAAKPTKNWRLYPFKNDESLPFIPVHKKSHYLLGRDRKVVEIALDHPSVSKQHAVIQFRMVELERKDGSKFKEIRPYLMDLESSNKTYLNNKEIDPLKYYQLLEKDVLKFGFSSREYVCLIDHDDEKTK